MKKDIKLPKLPYGQGSFTLQNGKVVLRKRIKFADGTFKSKAVYGDTPKECMEKMHELETSIQKTVIEPAKEVLCDEMCKWLEETKKSSLKSQSYTRLQSTIKNQIEPSSIGHLRYQKISTENVQAFLSSLTKNYSRSSIKKVYDCLNDFYRYYSLRYKFDNPMLLVQMPRIEESLAEDKNIVFFEDDDIAKFIEESKATWNTGNPKYQGSVMYAANIYLGMRMGELLALQWKDIDFNNQVISVYKTLIEEANPDYNPNDPNSKKVRFRVQEETKTSKKRYVPINSKAKELIELHKSRCEFTQPDDYVISTRNRKTTTVKNAGDTIKKICENAEMSVITGSTHCLRHTCASLYFRKGVSVDVVAKILGHSVDVCRSTYIHFINDQIQEAAKLIEVIDI